MRQVRAIALFPFLLLREVLTPRGRERTPEPMVMDEPDSVAQFHETGVGSGMNVPVYELCARATSRLLPHAGCVLDLGSGSARYLAHLAQRRPDAVITGIDLSDRMLSVGRETLAEEGLDGRVRLLRGDMTDFQELVPAEIDLVSCVFALHHLPSRDHLLRCLTQIAQVRERTGSAVWIWDFARLRHQRSFELYMSMLPEQEPVLLRDALASERAAWSLRELREAAPDEWRSSASLPLPSFQAHWAPRSQAGDWRGQGEWNDIPLPLKARLEHLALRASFRALP